jgi:adenine-specific DNA-methyltransferase
VEPVVLHEHERVRARVIVELARTRKDEVAEQMDLFARPAMPHHEVLKFYTHDVDWMNRLILGDSLLVMASLAERENLAGQVQMIYFDPPYGIKFASNFQPELGKRDVKDQDADLSREPEVVKAYRDTWTLGVHSYLTYLRARLLAAHRLLKETGSIFVQISDENVHRVRALLDEVFGAENFVVTLAFKRLGKMIGSRIQSSVHYVLWYSRDINQFKAKKLFERQVAGIGTGDHYNRVVRSKNGESRGLKEVGESPEWKPIQLVSLATGGYRPNTTVDFWFRGAKYHPGSNKCWRTTTEGLNILDGCERIDLAGSTIRYRQYLDDFPLVELGSLWEDTARDAEKHYVVQTPTGAIERCLLMTTDPGDLVLDPTCGSGTTAYVAEQWGRRWITIDTSRVAVAIARQRLLTATFDHFKTKGSEGPDQRSVNPRTGFVYKTVPHITLRSIAQNRHLDPIFARHQPLLDAALAACNAALAGVTAEYRQALARKLAEKTKAEGKRAVTEADERRWNLPKAGFEHWTVPFDTDEAWPAALVEAVGSYRKAWRAKMDEVEACIRANAEQEELVDQPEVDKRFTRVSGTFTVEGVKPPEQKDEEVAPAFGGAPDEAEDYEASTFSVVEGYLERMTALLKQDGITFPDNKRMAFHRLTLGGDLPEYLHADGVFTGADGAEGDRVVVSFGPQFGPVTGVQVEDAAREARRHGADHLVVAGFSFDAEASAAIQANNVRKLQLHRAHIRPDVNPGMDGLLKDTGARQQLFTVYGEPEIKLHKDGNAFVIELLGVDIYDPVTATVQSARVDKIAAWFLDPDYDGRTFCIGQAFFPDATAWDKIKRALKSEVDESVFATFSGARSLPITAGRHGRIAVKVIDPRGNEVMVVRKLGEVA